jgi:hypothetical protein
VTCVEASQGEHNSNLSIRQEEDVMNDSTNTKQHPMEHKQDINQKEPLIGGGDHDEYATTEEDVNFFHDFIAGGIAGSASVVVGHPFDTIKVSEIMLHILPLLNGHSMSNLEYLTHF